MTGKKSRPYERACSRICFLAASSSSGNGARVWEAISTAEIRVLRIHVCELCVTLHLEPPIVVRLIWLSRPKDRRSKFLNPVRASVDVASQGKLAFIAVAV